ncbi:uncharacterized protein LOC126750576 [Anthonomus grandis grandis]|uniref:uncharacterized protein LOC126750576 n=1 Tax=Anthonomus grandis grandis TaxID=2921223 RepID=UPI0021667D28|nr:uncharacterized protein LOC126750576 [Anthonomus grandis grandis]
MPCIKSKVGGLLVSPNIDDQKSMLEFFIKNLPDSAIAKYSKGRVKNDSEFIENENDISMTKTISLDEVGSEILNNAAQSVVLMEIASLKFSFSSCCETLYHGMMNEKQDILFNLEQNSYEWHEARKYRIAGSRCYEIYTYKEMDKDMKSKKYFWPKSFTNKYVKHGQMDEKPARECFVSKTDYKVIEYGMITSPENKWLGFSRDGVVLNTDRNPIALLEIKCLYSGITMSIEDSLQSYNFILKANGKYMLKAKHKYYGQVQLGMTILNLQKCSLCLYASYDDNCVIMEVEYDYTFSRTMLEKSKNNYFCKMLHSVCEDK